MPLDVAFDCGAEWYSEAVPRSEEGLTLNRSDGDVVKKTFGDKMASRETFLKNLTDDEVDILHGSIPDITKVHSTYVKELENFALEFLSDSKLTFLSRNAPEFVFEILFYCSKLHYLSIGIFIMLLSSLSMIFFGFISIFDLFIVFKYGGESLASFQRDLEVELWLAPIYRSIHTGFIGFDNFIRDVLQAALATKSSRFAYFVIFAITTLLITWIDRYISREWYLDCKAYSRRIKKFKALRKFRIFLEQIDS